MPVYPVETYGLKVIKFIDFMCLLEINTQMRRTSLEIKDYRTEFWLSHDVTTLIPHY